MKQILKQVSSLIFFLFLLVILFPSNSFATKYGQSTYGSAKYSQTELANPTQAGSSANPGPGCHLQSPGPKAPWLYGAIVQSKSSILLYFTDGDDPIDHYALEFGTKSGEYTWAATNIGGKGAGTYLVNSLTSNTTYYFRVRGGNGCAPGEWSNEISSTTKGWNSFNQLNIIDFKLEALKTNNEEDSTVTDHTKDDQSISGDSLEQGDENQEQVDGITVKVKVIDKEGNSSSGVKVILHSDPKEALTDENGVATFTNVESGEHKIIIKHDNQTGEQTINLSGEAEEYVITIQMELNNSNYSLIQVAGIVGFSLLSFILLLLLWKRQTRK